MVSNSSSIFVIWGFIAVCREFNVPVGHPHVGNDNVERVLEEGYRFLMASPVRSLAPLEKGRKLAGR